jgi:hypothetical protein
MAVGSAGALVAVGCTGALVAIGALVAAGAVVGGTLVSVGTTGAVVGVAAGAHAARIAPPVATVPILIKSLLEIFLDFISFSFVEKQTDELDANLQLEDKKRFDIPNITSFSPGMIGFYFRT